MAEGIHLLLLGMIIMFVRYMYRKYAADKVEELAPVVKAVINHGKDSVNQIKPAINNYVEKHQTTKVQYCIHCGKKCDDAAAFCVGCGKAI